MTLVTQDEKLIKSLDRISESLNQSKKLISSELVLDFQSKVNSVKENLSNIKLSERVMRIGIVGEVKAGKSSFLNALIFDGESILPKAPTPMTAALTKLGYSEQSSAKIVFYEDYDWQVIEKYNAEYNSFIFEKLESERMSYNPDPMGYIPPMPTFKSVEEMYKNQIPDHLVACHELVHLAEESDIDVSDYLGKTIVISGSSSIEEFIGELNNYVGTNGQYTPIVKHTEILMSNPLLQDIEIIDTPGLNDPILSRSEKTKEFLMNCDVAFLLSYSGQFLGSQDMDLLTMTLPSEGIRKAIVVGSKFDSGILDYKKRKASFEEAYKVSRRNFNEQAASNLKACMESNRYPAVIKHINESLPPAYVSSLMYSAAKHLEQNQPFTEEEETVINQMVKRFDGFETTVDFLYRLSNIKKVRENTFTTLKNEKDETIAERIADITNNQKNKFLSILENMNIAARHNQTDLDQYDFEQIQNKLKNLMKKLNSIRSEVKSIFELSNIEAQRILKDLEIEVAKEIDNHIGVNVLSRTETRRESVKTGLFGLSRDNFTVTDTISFANVQDVTASLRKFTTSAKKIVNSQFKSLFNINHLKKQLKDAVIGAFDLSDETFNEKDILMPMEIVLGKLSIPDIEIDIKGHDETILRKFSTGVVEGTAISQLMLEQDRLLKDLSMDIEKSIRATSEHIEAILLEEASVFVDKIEEQLANNVEIIQNLLIDKEQSLKEYDQFINQISQFKAEIRQA